MRREKCLFGEGLLVGGRGRAEGCHSRSWEVLVEMKLRRFLCNKSSFGCLEERQEGRTYGCSNSSRALSVWRRCFGFFTPSSPDVSAKAVVRPASRLTGEATMRL